LTPQSHLLVSASPLPQACQNTHTFNNDILHTPLLRLALPLTSLLLLDKLWQDQRSNSLDDAREDGVSGVQKPGLCKRRVIEIDSTFEDGILGYAEVSAYWRHE
jgi:hypothetical protein